MADTKHILVVDDDEIVRSLLRRIFSKMGCAVVTVPGSSEAFKHLAESKFDLIVIDLIMPMSDGWDLLEKIRAMPDGQDVPVVVMTGLYLAEDERKKIAMKSNAIVSKQDFKINEFKNIVSGLL